MAGFGAPLGSPGIAVADFMVPDNVVQIGLPPRRIDVLTAISGVTFEGAWERRETISASGLSIPVLGRRDLQVGDEAKVGEVEDAVM